jgi:hypothetical protein
MLTLRGGESELWRNAKRQASPIAKIRAKTIKSVA